MNHEVHLRLSAEQLEKDYLLLQTRARMLQIVIVNMRTYSSFLRKHLNMVRGQDLAAFLTMRLLRNLGRLEKCNGGRLAQVIQFAALLGYFFPVQHCQDQNRTMQVQAALDVEL